MANSGYQSVGGIVASYFSSVKLNITESANYEHVYVNMRHRLVFQIPAEVVLLKITDSPVHRTRIFALQKKEICDELQNGGSKDEAAICKGSNSFILFAFFISLFFFFQQKNTTHYNKKSETKSMLLSTFKC